jgi:hypothetical protein
MMDSCTGEECTDTPWKHGDNYPFWHKGKEEGNLHKYQKNQFKHEMVESAVYAIKKTRFPKELIHWFDENLKDWGRIELAGRGINHLNVYAPGVKSKEPSEWSMLFTPSLRRKGNSFGYNIGLNGRLAYKASTTGELIWQPQDEITRLKINHTFIKGSNNKNPNISLEATVSYDQKTKNTQAYIGLNWNF